MFYTICFTLTCGSFSRNQSTKRGLQTWLTSSLLSFSEDAPQLATCRDSILLPTSKAMSKELQPSCSEKARLHVVAGPLTKSKGCTYYVWYSYVELPDQPIFQAYNSPIGKAKKTKNKQNERAYSYSMARPFPTVLLFLIGPGSDSHKLTKLTTSNRCQLDCF